MGLCRRWEPWFVSAASDDSQAWVALLGHRWCGGNGVGACGRRIASSEGSPESLLDAPLSVSS
jgi:hypothetical protein